MYTFILRTYLQLLLVNHCRRFNVRLLTPVPERNDSGDKISNGEDGVSDNPQRHMFRTFRPFFSVALKENQPVENMERIADRAHIHAQAERRPHNCERK